MTASPALDALRAYVTQGDAFAALIADCTLARRFESDQTFGAVNAAEAWLLERGLEAGAASIGNPLAVFRRDDEFIGSSKWRNLPPETIRQLAGVVVGERRTGPIEVWLRAGVLS